MIKVLFIIMFCLFACAKQNNHKFNVLAEEKLVRKVLENQQNNWNNGNIDSFMNSYWNSDSLQFISRGKVKKGWNETIEGYKKNYPDKETMGNLDFDVLTITNLSPKNFLVTGRFKLIRIDSSMVEGMFTLVFRKINNEWVIIYDHTST